jgi:histidine triad (HIT) family protein
VRPREKTHGEPSCRFCEIISGQAPARIVFEDDVSLAFLDSRPLFPGHTLLVPKDHYETLTDLPDSLIHPLFSNTQRLTGVVRNAMNAEGTFVAMNNVVSQSVPHFHVHIVPRRRKDGLRGFFWPRGKYANEDEEKSVQGALITELQKEAAAAQRNGRKAER